MLNKRKIEVITAGCPVCDEAVQLVERITCPSCEVEVLDAGGPEGARRIRELGVGSLPAVAVDGKLAACCVAGGVTEEALRAEGVGQPL